MALDDDFLYQLKNANNIESVMSSYTNIKRAGHNFVCLCPFHSEKSPSCTIYPDTQSFYCFGCGAGGDVITFIMKIENLDYIEAVKYLAERGNIPFPDNKSDDKQSKLKKRIFEINKKTAKFYYSQLKTEEGKKGLVYILNRGLNPDTIKKYGIGFASNKWNTLKNYLLSEGYSEDELISAGVCSKSRSGNVYDVFRNRVIFPIIDLRGNIIAFGGRLIDGEGPKYLNSSDTPVFKKSRNLFSLNFAKNCNENELILCEGYMDVIAVNQAGFENVVATLGTALTSEQARLISQYVKDVVLSYDSDEAGQKATMRAINLLSEVGINTRILKIVNAKDPDEFIKKYGVTRFKKLIEGSSSAIQFEIEKCKHNLDMDNDSDKIEFIKKATKVLADVESRVERDVYISRISNDLSVSKDILVSEVNAILTKRKRSQEKKEWRSIESMIATKRNHINPDAVKYPKEAKAEEGIISFLFYHPDHLDKIIDKITENSFITEFNKKIFKKLIKGINENQEISLSTFSGVFNPDEMGKISEMLAKTRDIDINLQTVRDYINVLLSHNDSIAEKEDLSDEEFLDFFNQLKQKNK